MSCADEVGAKAAATPASGASSSPPPPQPPSKAPIAATATATATSRQPVIGDFSAVFIASFRLNRSPVDRGCNNFRKQSL